MKNLQIFNNKFNERLSFLRQEAGLSMDKLAEKVGLSKSSINMYERGEREPGINALISLSNFFNVSVDYLVGKIDAEAISIKKKDEEYGLTDDQVEAEIARLNSSEAVALARHEQRLKYRRRQYLYQLRDYEKKGKALIEAGMTREVLDALYKNGNEEE